MLMAKHIESAATPAIPLGGQTLHIEYWPIAKLKDYERNPRKNDGAVNRMVASITEFGFSIPVLARSAGEVVDGHLRLKAARKLGMAEVPVIPCDGWTDAQVKAFRLMVNRSVTWADWDIELLAAEFGDLKALDFDLTLTGFDAREIDAFTLQPNAAEDEVPPVPETPRNGSPWKSTLPRSSAPPSIWGNMNRKY
jgi:ParB-like chromosome segregation protein Spo0J